MTPYILIAAWLLVMAWLVWRIAHGHDDDPRGW